MSREIDLSGTVGGSLFILGGGKRGWRNYFEHETTTTSGWGLIQTFRLEMMGRQCKGEERDTDSGVRNRLRNTMCNKKSFRLFAGEKWCVLEDRQLVCGLMRGDS